MTQGDLKGRYKKKSIRAQKGQIAAARTKQHGGEEHTGKRAARGGDETKRETKKYIYIYYGGL